MRLVIVHYHLRPGGSAPHKITALTDGLAEVTASLLEGVASPWAQAYLVNGTCSP